MVISYENDLIFLNLSKLVIEDLRTIKKLELQWLAIQRDKSLDTADFTPSLEISVFPVSSKWVSSRDSTILMILTVVVHGLVALGRRILGSDRTKDDQYNQVVIYMAEVQNSAEKKVLMQDNCFDYLN